MTKLIDTPKCLLVEVPEGAEQFYIPMNSQGLWYKINGKPHFEIILPPGSYGQPILASEMTTEKIVEVFGFVQGEPPYQPYYRPYGMSEEEYIHEVRIAENKLAEWEAENHPDNQFIELLSSHNLQPSNTVVIPKTI